MKLDAKNRTLLVVLALLITAVLAIYIYKPLLDGNKQAIAHNEELAADVDELDVKRDELINFFPEETARLSAELKEKRDALADYSNNYDYHYELVNLAAEHGLSAMALEIGEPASIVTDTGDAEMGEYIPFIRVVTLSLSGRLESYLNYVDAVNALGENVKVETSFVLDSNEYLIRVMFYSIAQSTEAE